MGIFSDIGSMFGAVQEKRAAGTAVRMIQEAQRQGLDAARDIQKLTRPFYESSRDAFSTGMGLLENYIARANALTPDTGMQAADLIAMQDAQRVMNENLSKTGNLRSGAAAFANTELARRVTADINLRSYGQRVAQLQALFGGVGAANAMGTNQGALAGRGEELAAGLISASMGMAPYAGGFEMKKGESLGQIPALVGGFMDRASQAAASYVANGGASSSMLKNLFTA